MVLTVSYHDNGLTNSLIGCETARCQLYGGLDIGSLTGYKSRADGIQEYLGRYEVTGDRQLHKGVTGKYYKTYLVILELVDKV